jgi:hypothetical protein
MRTTIQSKRYANASSNSSSQWPLFKHERCLPARTFKLIKCSNSWPFRSAHYDVLATCFLALLSVWLPIHFGIFNFVLICDVVVISRVMLHWHAAWSIFSQSFTFAMKHSQVCKWCISSDGRTQQILCCLLILNFCCKFPPCIIRPAGQGIFPGPAGFFPALCDQLAKIAFGMLLRLLGSEVPTVPANSRHVAPWTVVAESNPPFGLDALIRATASQCLLLDVPVLYRHSFGNMTL